MKHGLQTKFAAMAGISTTFANELVWGKKLAGYDTAKRLVKKFPGTTLAFWMKEAEPHEIQELIEKRFG